MKCPKCGYISFDYNDECPKCKKELSSVRGKLNLYSFKPDPPSFLESLTGGSAETGDTLSTTSDSQFNILDTEIEFAAEKVPEQAEYSETDETDEIEIELGSEITETGKDERVVPIATEETLGTGQPSYEIYDTDSSTDEWLQELETEELGQEKEPTLEVPDFEDQEEIEPVELELDKPSPSDPATFEEASVPDILDTDEPSLEISATDIQEEQSEETMVLHDHPSVTDKPLEIPPDDLEETSVEEELPLSLDDLKDDELGEVDVNIDTSSLDASPERVSAEV